MNLWHDDIRPAPEEWEFDAVSDYLYPWWLEDDLH